MSRWLSYDPATGRCRAATDRSQDGRNVAHRKRRPLAASRDLDARQRYQPARGQHGPYEQRQAA